MKAVQDSEEHTRLNPEQIENIVPLMLRNTQVGSSVQLSELHGKDIEEQIDMFILSAQMLASAQNKGLKKFKHAEGQIAYTSVATAGRCTTVLAVNPQAGKFTEASKDRSGSQVEDHRLRLGEVAHFSTFITTFSDSPVPSFSSRLGPEALVLALSASFMGRISSNCKCLFWG